MVLRPAVVVHNQLPEPLEFCFGDATDARVLREGAEQSLCGVDEHLVLRLRLPGRPSLDC